MSRDLRIPDRDLVADLVIEPDPYMGNPNGDARQRPEPRLVRLHVASWMLSDGTRAGNTRAMREAFELYEWSGTGLLDRPRQLTTADVVAEVLQLISKEQT